MRVDFAWTTTALYALLTSLENNSIPLDFEVYAMLPGRPCSDNGGMAMKFQQERRIGREQGHIFLVGPYESIFFVNAGRLGIARGFTFCNHGQSHTCQSSHK